MASVSPLAAYVSSCQDMAKMLLIFHLLARVVPHAVHAYGGYFVWLKTVRARDLCPLNRSMFARKRCPLLCQQCIIVTGSSISTS